MPFALYDFTDTRKRSVIQVWIADEDLTKRDIAQLNQKIDMLQMNGFELHPGLLSGPIGKQRHVYKLVIHAQRMLRPMLCKGPFDMEREFTFLLGAVEQNFKLNRDPADATKNRETLLVSPGRRIAHERY